MTTLKKLDKIISVTGNIKFKELKLYYLKYKVLSKKQVEWVNRFYYSVFESVNDEIEYDHTLYGYDI